MKGGENMDKYTWSLDELYTSFDSEKFKNDVEDLKNGIKNINEWCKENLADNTNALEKAESYINMQNLIGSLASSLRNIHSFL